MRDRCVKDLTEVLHALKPVAEPAAVTEIFPSGEILPENTLRFYIHFSVPMRSGVATTLSKSSHPP